ncbi:MAG: hypothetical protein B7733_19625 [Myxococcales bacterium FL481]|nr:MAG: hypothetical protein B7733_19625 [Myxococcales bacterium FL481]
MAPIPARAGARPSPRASWWFSVRAWSRVMLLMGCGGAGTTACSPTESALRERTFHPGERQHDRDSTVVELQHAHYGPQTVRLRVRLRNEGATAVQVPRDGILLAYDGLEYPLDTATATGITDPIVLPPGRDHHLVLRFRLARAMTREAKLLLRGMTRNAEALTPLRLTIPALLATSATTIDSDATGRKN